MESSIFRQIAELAREHKTAARATAVFLCLALVVTAVTAAVLTSTGHAMTRQVKVLTCPLTVHEHTPECWDAEGNQICGYADYVVHVHNDDCYGEDGALVCTLREVYPHTHQDSCYEELRTPICGQEEAQPHVHTEACYLREQGELTCTQAEHTHGPDCFLREEVLTCDKTEQEHVHNDSCYTVSRELSCGLEESEEHTHTDSCYTEVRTLTCDLTMEPHDHGPECYTVNETLICDIPEHTHTDDCYAWTETLTCQIPEGAIPEGGHVHTDECFETSRNLICGQLEMHEHTDECFELDEAGNRVGNPICGQIELLEHVHGEDCFTIEERPVEGAGNGPFFFETTGEDPEVPAKEYICGLEEHTHDDSCRDEAGEIVCGLEEHTHDESCLAPAPEAEEPQLICGKEEHTHDESCRNEAGEIVCGLEEHTHDETCLAPAPEAEEPAEESSQFVCGKEEHLHSDACKDENGEIVCGVEEHVHDASCLAVPENGGAKVYRDSSVLITVVYPAEANLPEDVTLRAGRLTPEENLTAYEGYLEQMQDAAGEIDLSAVVLYDIGFYTSDGVEVEPEATVTVNIQFLDESGLITGAPLTVVHFAEEGATVLESVTEGNSVSFGTDSFSPFSIFLDAAFGVTRGEPATIAVDSEKVDPYINFFKLYKDGKEIPDGGTVVLGDNYELKLNFSEKGDKQFKSDHLTFQLPAGVKSFATEGTIYTEEGAAAGHYTIDENGKVDIYLDNIEDEDTWCEMNFFVVADGTSEGGGLTLPWEGGKDFTYKTEEAPAATLEKKAGEYDPANHTIPYTVEVEVTGGRLKEVQLQDLMEQGVSLDEGSVKITVTDETGKDITASLDPQPTLKKTTNGWEINGLPDPLNKGQKVTIEYDAVVNFDGKGEQIKLEQGENRFSFTVENTVTMTDKPHREDKDKEPWVDNTKTPIVDDQIKKSVSKKDVNGETLLDWEIELGTGSADVRDTLLTDELGAKQTYSNAKPFEIKWKDANGNTIKTYSIEDWTGGYSDLLKVENGQFTLDLKELEDSFWEGVPGDPTRRWQPGDYIKIEYYTKPEDADGEYENSVNATIFDVEFEIGRGIVVGTASVSKGATDTGSSLDYTITVDVPGREFIANYRAGTSENADIGRDTGPGFHGVSEFDDNGVPYDPHKVFPYFNVRDTEFQFYDVQVGTDADGNPITKDYTVDLSSIPLKDFYENMTVKAVFDNGEEIVFQPYDQVTPGDTSTNSYRIARSFDPDIGDYDEDIEGQKTNREFVIWFNTHLRTNKLGRGCSVWMIEDPCQLIISYKIPDTTRVLREDENGTTTYDGVYVDDGHTVRDLLKNGWVLSNHAEVRSGSNVICDATYKHTKPEKQLEVTKNSTLPYLNDAGEYVIDYTVRFLNYENFVNKEGKDDQRPVYDIDPKNFAFYDSYDPKLEYVPNSLKLTILTPSKWGESVRGWYKCVEDPRYFTNNTEDHTLEATVDAFGEAGGEHGDTWFENPHEGTWKGLRGNDTLHEWMEANNKHTDQDDKWGVVYSFTYQMKVKGSELKAEEMTFDNTASVQYALDKEPSDSSQTKLFPKLLDKSHVMSDTENKITYTIVVNHGAVNMVTIDDPERGDGYDPDSYHVTDIMSPELTLVDGSLKIMYQVSGEDGQLTSPQELPRTDDPSKVTPETPAYYFSYPETGENGFVLTVPDNMRLTITYDTLVSGKAGEEVDVWNTVSVNSSITIADKDESEFELKRGGATTGSTPSFRLLKKDGLSDKYLDGSEFTVYRLDGSGEGVEIKGRTYGFAETVKPDKYEVGVEDSQDGVSIKQVTGYDDYYVLFETKAPDGYVAYDTPYVFKFGETPEVPEYVDVTFNGKTYEHVLVNYMNDSQKNYTVDNPPAPYELPDSGGEGFGPLYAVGIAMIALSAVMLLETSQRKRKGGAA